MFFRKSHVRTNKLDVQETDFSFAQLNRILSISVDTGLGMDGIPALDLWDRVIEMLHSSCDVLAQGNPSRDEIQSKHTNTNTKTKRHGNRDNDGLSSVDHVVASAKPSHFEAMLYIFEGTEAVITINDHEGQKSYDGTRVPNAQSRA